MSRRRSPCVQLRLRVRQAPSAPSRPLLCLNREQRSANLVEIYRGAPNEVERRPRRIARPLLRWSDSSSVIANSAPGAMMNGILRRLGLDMCGGLWLFDGDYLRHGTIAMQQRRFGCKEPVTSFGNPRIVTHQQTYALPRESRVIPSWSKRLENNTVPPSRIAQGDEPLAEASRLEGMHRGNAGSSAVPGTQPRRESNDRSPSLRIPTHALHHRWLGRSRCWRKNRGSS